jgi:flagellum-specific peptidoglycan hydrolase FlgJ
MNPKIFQLMFYMVRAFWPSIKVSAAYPLAQAYHESKGWTSDLYLRANNMFGMKPATKRSTTASGVSGAYASYSSPLDSIRDYFKRLDYFKITNDAELLKDIKTVYATDPKYLQLVEATRVKLSPQLIPSALVSAFSLLLFIGVVYAGIRGLNSLSNA